jgi:hypothetical protein
MVLFEKRDGALVCILCSVIVQPGMQRWTDGENGGENDPDDEQTRQSRFAPVRTNGSSVLHADEAYADNLPKSKGIEALVMGQVGRAYARSIDLDHYRLH